MMKIQSSVRPLLVRCSRCSYATTSTSTSAPPMLLKLRSDMKNALKAKDTNRLNVLRALLAETTNAAKTSSPIRTDIQLLSLLRKRAAASKSAASEFSAANRHDLEDKEVAQIAVLEEYAGTIHTVGEEEISSTVTAVLARMKTAGQKLDIGSVLKALVGEDGELHGKPIERAEVARIVKTMM